MDNIIIYAIQLEIFKAEYTDRDFLGAYRTEEKAQEEIDRLKNYRVSKGLAMYDREYSIVEIELRD